MDLHFSLVCVFGPQEPYHRSWTVWRRSMPWRTAVRKTWTSCTACFRINTSTHYWMWVRHLATFTIHPFAFCFVFLFNSSVHCSVLLCPGRHFVVSQEKCFYVLGGCVFLWRVYWHWLTINTPHSVASEHEEQNRLWDICFECNLLLNFFLLQCLKTSTIDKHSNYIIINNTFKYNYVRNELIILLYQTL